MSIKSKGYKVSRETKLEQINKIAKNTELDFVSELSKFPVYYSIPLNKIEKTCIAIRKLIEKELGGRNV